MNEVGVRVEEESVVDLRDEEPGFDPSTEEMIAWLSAIGCINLHDREMTAAIRRKLAQTRTNASRVDD